MGETRSEWLKEKLEEYDGQILGLSQKGRQKKYLKMAVSPYTFFRGSAFLFFSDLLQDPLYAKYSARKPTWVQGDLHFENFGTFHDSEGEIVFDINDFDEAYLGSYILDVSRMIVSIVLVATELGLSPEKTEASVHRYLKSYRKQIAKYANREESPLTCQYTLHNTKGPIHKLLRKVEKSRSRDSLFERFITETVDGWKFNRNDELEDVDTRIAEQILANWDTYIHSIPTEQRLVEGHYIIKDIVHKRNSGTGSIGLDRFYLLIEGEQADHTKDDIILEMKEARYSVLDSLLPSHDEFHEQFPHPGEQVVISQRAMHHQSDPFLGIMSIDEKTYYVRERSPYKSKLTLKHIKDEDDFLSALKIMGKLTAKIHARADADIEQGLFAYHSEEMIMASIEQNRQEWYQLLTTFAMDYANKVKEDYAIFLVMQEEYHGHRSSDVL